MAGDARDTSSGDELRRRAPAPAPRPPGARARRPRRLPVRVPGPGDTGAAFRLLVDLDVVDEELSERLARAAGLRNVLVHAYLDVDPQQVWNHLDRLDDFERFAAAVQGHAQDESA